MLYIKNKKSGKIFKAYLNLLEELCFIESNDKIDEFIYIGRPSIYGNPFKVSDYGKGNCVDLYKNNLKEPILKEIEKLKVKSKDKNICLECFCKPRKCHGDVIIEMILKNPL